MINPNLVKVTEYEQFYSYEKIVYNTDILNECREIHKKLVTEGKMEGDFYSEKWKGNTGIQKVGLDFKFDEILYNEHASKRIEVSIHEIGNILRCYVIYCCGVYTYPTIQKKLNTIKNFLQNYKEEDFELRKDKFSIIEEFLFFAGLHKCLVTQIFSNIRTTKKDEKVQKKSKEVPPAINYFVIENEINHIYKEECDEVFKKWFPIYFWVNINFKLPLTVTEMLLTPNKCIYRENDKIFVKLYHSKLSKEKKATNYDTNDNYEEFSYEISDMEVIRNIEKYIKLTDFEKKQFLFECNEPMNSHVLSVKEFNHLLSVFVEESIANNDRYDFVKYAIDIKKFEPVRADDSRKIAVLNMIIHEQNKNMYRQFSKHIINNTGSNYYVNIPEVIWASSVIQLHQKLDCQKSDSKKQYEGNGPTTTNKEESECISPKRMKDEYNIDDCIELGRLDECIGCIYYRPTKIELETFMSEEKKLVNEKVEEFIELIKIINTPLKIEMRGLSLEHVILLTQKCIARYRMGCNIKANDKLQEWQKHKNAR